MRHKVPDEEVRAASKASHLSHTNNQGFSLRTLCQTFRNVKKQIYLQIVRFHVLDSRNSRTTGVTGYLAKQEIYEVGDVENKVLQLQVDEFYLQDEQLHYQHFYTANTTYSFLTRLYSCRSPDMQIHCFYILGLKDMITLIHYHNKSSTANKLKCLVN